MMKHMTFAVALATATALSGTAMAEGSGAKSQQGAQMEQGAQIEQTSGTAMGQSAGMSGENLDSDQIRKIQQALNDAGHDIAVDGIWGENTSRVLYQYQQEQGLQASGELDAQTVAELGVEVGDSDTMGTQQALTPDDSSMPADSGATGGDAGAGAEADTETTPSPTAD